MQIFSKSFMIDDKYSYTYENDSIPIEINDISSETKSLALIFYDLHPMANKWIHWAVINIPISTKIIPSGASNSTRMPSGCTELINYFGEKGYGGMCPPKEDGIHQYQLSIFELNIDKINIPNNSTSYDNFKINFANNIINETSLVGLYQTK